VFATPLCAPVRCLAFSTSGGLLPFSEGGGGWDLFVFLIASVGFLPLSFFEQLVPQKEHCSAWTMASRHWIYQWFWWLSLHFCPCL
jgi:hypothetical protein